MVRLGRERCLHALNVVNPLRYFYPKDRITCCKQINFFLMTPLRKYWQDNFDSTQYLRKKFLMLYIFHNVVIKYNSSFLLAAREYEECGDTIKGPSIQNDLLRNHREFIWFQLNFSREGNPKPRLSLKSLWQFSGIR